MTLSAKLIEQRDALVAEVDTTLAAEEVTAEALDAASVKQDEIAALDERIATAQANEKRTAALAESRKESGVVTFGGAKVTREAMTYDKDGRNSYFRDLTAATIRGDRDAFERLYRHQSEIDVETRDISRTDTSGGDFVPP
jgi:hypothetical protein